MEKLVIQAGGGTWIRCLPYIATNELTSAPIYDRYQPTNTDGHEGSKQNLIELFIFIQNFVPTPNDNLSGQN